MNVTSIESYREALESGLIGKKQMQVLAFCIENDNEEGVSQGECGRHFDDQTDSYQPRFRELEDSGLLKCVGTKLDPVTHRHVKAYRPTGKIPTERVRRKRKFTRATFTPVRDGLFRVDPPLNAVGPIDVEYRLAG